MSPAPRTPRRNGRRGPQHAIAPEEIVRVALEAGVDRFTMQDLSRGLGISHQALYRWVSGRDEVLDLVAEHVVRQITPPPLRPDGDWGEWLAEFARTIRAALLASPGMALRGLTRHQVSASFVRLYARGIESLVAGGLTQAQARGAMEVFGTTVLALVVREQSLHEQRRAGRQIGEEIASARAEAALAPVAPSRPLAPDERFDAVVATVVAGIAARAREAAPAE